MDRGLPVGYISAMVSLMDFLPPSHPLRQRLDLADKPKPPAKPTPPKVEPPKPPLFLTTRMFLNPYRTKVTQEYAGVSPIEVLKFLTKRGFSPVEVDELVSGNPFEPNDGKCQYVLEHQLPEKSLGDFLLVRPKKETPVPRVEPETPKGWGMKIRKLREDAGFSQTTLSKLMGFGSNQFNPIEYERRKFSADEFDTFCKVLSLKEGSYPKIPLATEQELAMRPPFSAKAPEVSEKVASAPVLLEPIPETPMAEQFSKDAVTPENKLPEEEPMPAREIPPTPSVGVPTPLEGNTPVYDVREAAKVEMTKILYYPGITNDQISKLLTLFNTLALQIILSK